MSTLIRTEVGTDLRRARVDVRSGALRPMVITSGPAYAKVALIAQGALLLAGDEVAIEVEVGQDTTLEIVEPSGTVAYDMRGGCASWRTRITLHDGAKLIWHGEPFVVSEGADVTRTTTVHLGADAACLLRECLVLGRTAERPGRLAATMRASDGDGPLLVEDLDLSPEAQVGGALGTNRVLSTVTCLGGAVARVPEEHRFTLQRGGVLWRRLAASAHGASLEHAWTSLLAHSGVIPE